MRAAALIAVVLSACAGAEGPTDPLLGCKGACRPDQPLFAVDTMRFAGLDDAGRADGFDLDGSVGPKRQDCIAEDFTSPDGAPGVDNQMARFLPLLLQAIGEALPTLIQAAIDDGGLSLMYELLPAVEEGRGPALAFHRAQGKPLLGADGRLLADQTYAVVAEPPIAVCRDAVVSDRRIECAGFDMPLAIVVFGILYELQFREARIRIDLDEEGRTARVLVGGGVKVDDVIQLVRGIRNGPQNLVNTVEAILPSLVDLVGPDTDTCDRFSGAVVITARRGFALPGAP